MTSGSRVVPSRRWRFLLVLLATMDILQNTSEYFHFLLPDAHEVYPFNNSEIIQNASIDVPIDQVEFSAAIQDHLYFDMIDFSNDLDKVFF